MLVTVSRRWHRARGDADDADHALEQGALAGAIGPDHRDHLARIGADGDVVDHRVAAVAGRDATARSGSPGSDLIRQGRPPRPPACPRSCPMVPSASTAPSAMHHTGSQNSSMMDSSCSTMRMVMPSAQSATSSLPIRRARRGCTPGHGLVEQQHPRLRHQRPHDLHQPPLPAAEIPGVAVRQRRAGRTARASSAARSIDSALLSPASTAAPPGHREASLPGCPGPRTPGSPSPSAA